MLVDPSELDEVWSVVSVVVSVVAAVYPPAMELPVRDTVDRSTLTWVRANGPVAAVGTARVWVAAFVAVLLSVKLPACAAVTAIGEVLNYAFDWRNNLAELRRLFRR